MKHYKFKNAKDSTVIVSADKKTTARQAAENYFRSYFMNTEVQFVEEVDFGYYAQEGNKK